MTRTDAEDPDFALFSILNRLSETPLRYRHINLLDILRNDLAQKIARAQRARHSPERFEAAYEFSDEYRRSPIRLSRALSRDTKQLLRGAVTRGPALAADAKRVFFWESPKLRSIAEALSERSSVVVLSNKRDFTTEAVFVPVTAGPHLLAARRTAREYVEPLKKRIDDRDILLLEEDLLRLSGDLVNAVYQVNRTYRYLDTSPVDLVVVAGDNFLPPLALVLAARQRNVPTLCLQHGLDCERFCHEQIYSDYLCVWGKTRAKRCRENSRHQPRKIHVTGCPEFDELRLAPPRDRPKGRWLWLTRPHTPDKCYEPSRYPDEGMRIFSALVREFVSFRAERLVIKAHPRDDTRPYRRIVADHHLEDRVVFLQGRGGVDQPIEEAGVVFSEDSTSGMEAMFWGKPIIHTHFSASPPSLPLVEYGAALPGFHPDEVRSSVQRLYGFSEEEMESMRECQARFLADFAGPLDGQAKNRVCALIEGILWGG